VTLDSSKLDYYHSYYLAMTYFIVVITAIARLIVIAIVIEQLMFHGYILKLSIRY